MKLGVVFIKENMLYDVFSYNVEKVAFRCFSPLFAAFRRFSPLFKVHEFSELIGPAAAFPFHLKRAVELMKSKVVKAHYGLVRKTPETTIVAIGMSLVVQIRLLLR